MRKTLVDRLAERIAEPVESDLLWLEVNCLAPVVPFAPLPAVDAPSAAVPIVAGELVLPDWDGLLGAGR